MSRRTITAAIVDDERPARRLLRKLVDKESDIQIVADCANVTSAISEISEIKPDLIFLDIRMPKRDGFDLLRALDPAYQPMVVFVTAYNEYAVKAFDYHALDYILKPIDPVRFKESLSRIRTMSESLRLRHRKSLRQLLRDWEKADDISVSNNELNIEYDGKYIKRLFVKHRQQIVAIALDRTESFESEGHFVRIRASHGDFLIYSTLAGLEARLDPSQFIRIHRKTIVRIKSIVSIIQGDCRSFVVRLNSGRELRVSRSRRHLIGPLLMNAGEQQD